MNSVKFFLVSIIMSCCLGLHAQTSNILIGNYYYSAPNGIAFIKEGQTAFVINPMMGANRFTAVLFDEQEAGFAQAHQVNDYNASIVAPDDSYHCIRFQTNDNSNVTIEWSRVRDAAIGRMVASHPTNLSFDLTKNWPGFKSSYQQTLFGIEGMSKGTFGECKWQMNVSDSLVSFDGKHATWRIGDSGKPTYFVAGFGALPDFQAIDHLLKEACQKYERKRPKAITAIGDFVGAMTNNLNNTRVYSNDDRLLFIPVSRSFGLKNANQAPVFCWDSFFNGLMATYDNPAMAKATFRAVLDGALPNGMIGNVRHWSMGPSTGNSQPPVGAMCIWRAHLLHPDIEFLREAYPVLKAWNAWWMKYRNAKKDSLLEWGDEGGSFEIAMYETGYDDTPHFQGVKGVKMIGTTMNCYAVDLCALWAMDAHYLSLIADAIGDKIAAEQHKKDSEEMNKRINEKLWNEKLGIYCSRFWDNEDGTPGDFLTKLGPQNFYPLISGAANKEQAKRVLQIMTDPEQFWGEWILPTISRKEPEFIRQRYWSGNIWGPSNYLVWLGVKKYAPAWLKASYAQKSVHLFMNNWNGAGYCGENYFATTGRVCSNPNYTWGALLCLTGIESLIDISDDGDIIKGSGFNEACDLYNIMLLGEPYHISLKHSKSKSKMNFQK